MAESDLDKDLAGLMNDIGGSDSADAGGGGIPSVFSTPRYASR